MWIITLACSVFQLSHWPVSILRNALYICIFHSDVFLITWAVYTVKHNTSIFRKTLKRRYVAAFLNEPSSGLTWTIKHYTDHSPNSLAVYAVRVMSYYYNYDWHLKISSRISDILRSMLRLQWTRGSGLGSSNEFSSVHSQPKTSDF
jgi:hypothetical protein